MLRAPIPDALRSNSLIRADNAIDDMTLKQLSTGIVLCCLSGGLATSDVALVHCTMQHPFSHSFPNRLARAAHKFLSALREPRVCTEDEHKGNLAFCCHSKTPDPPPCPKNNTHGQKMTLTAHCRSGK